MATGIVQDRWMNLQRIPKIFLDTYWGSGLCCQRRREQKLHHDEITMIDNRIELYLLMLKMGKVGHRSELPQYVVRATIPRKRGASIQEWTEDAYIYSGKCDKYDHVEFYKIKGLGRSLWITITSPYTDKYTEELKKDGFTPVKPIYAPHASSYIRVQISEANKKVSLMSEEDCQKWLNQIKNDRLTDNNENL